MTMNTWVAEGEIQRQNTGVSLHYHFAGRHSNLIGLLQTNRCEFYLSFNCHDGS